MACVQAVIPIPNTKKKTDELFLHWLSEPSTQELLRKELANISGLPFSELDENAPKEGQTSLHSFLTSSAAVTNVLRPGSPNMRTPSPPPSSHRSPKSPRGAVRTRSPNKRAVRSPSSVKSVKGRNGLHQQGVDEIDFYTTDDINGIHHPLASAFTAAAAEVEGLDLSPARRGGERERRLRSHSPKPESLPVGPTANQIPRPGAKSSQIPQFYFPNGKPQLEENLQDSFAELSKLFQQFPDGEVDYKKFPEVMKVSQSVLLTC